MSILGILVWSATVIGIAFVVLCLWAAFDACRQWGDRTAGSDPHVEGTGSQPGRPRSS